MNCTASLACADFGQANSNYSTESLMITSMASVHVEVIVPEIVISTIVVVERFQFRTSFSGLVPPLIVSSMASMHVYVFGDVVVIEAFAISHTTNNLSFVV